MGTNHYFRWTEQDGTCPHCGSPTELNHELHMGKSSIGWYYLLRGYEGLGVWDNNNIDNLSDWLLFMHQHPNGKIFTEYDEPIELEYWLGWVLARARTETSMDIHTVDGYYDVFTNLFWGASKGNRKANYDLTYEVSYRDFC